MKRLLFRLILAGGLVGLAYSFAGETAAIAAAALVVAAILWSIVRSFGRSGRRDRWQSGGGSTAAPQAAVGGKPPAPSREDFRAAGVRVDVCTRCQKPLTSMGHVFGLAGKPTVYCAPCWTRATNVVQDSSKTDAWWDRLTTQVEQRRL